ncbi:Endo-1,4-beta-xylanase A precursor [Rubripirellula tenax]|uniref:Endo-1,4-beta-xylanase A n=1 Tax=Rubripirellula tenax TaxID=2528015 RepID=A0A5C6EIS8_9BACT|nr:sugar-binding protein [Rubripirellula tenax]TWU48698.1 Endo-1,4-beta-xylanase A precursor [Rubripirellula tenax]
MLRAISFAVASISICFSPCIARAGDEADTEAKTATESDSSAVKGVVAIAAAGSPVIDGEIDEVWSTATAIKVDKPITDLTQVSKEEMSTGEVRVLWSSDKLSVLWQVSDKELSAISSEDWAQDSIELFVDRNHEATASYQDDDAQYRVNFKGQVSGRGLGFVESDVKAVSKKTDTGYLVEMSINMTDSPLHAGDHLGLELQVNNDDGSGERVSVAKWSHAENDSFESTENFGTLTLK